LVRASLSPAKAGGNPHGVDGMRNTNTLIYGVSAASRPS
jgi:hypothetical protein